MDQNEERFIPYDPTSPPPDWLVIPISEWRKYEACVSRLFGQEALLNELIDVIQGREPYSFDLEQKVQHWKSMNRS